MNGPPELSNNFRFFSFNVTRDRALNHKVVDKLVKQLNENKELPPSYAQNEELPAYTPPPISLPPAYTGNEQHSSQTQDDPEKTLADYERYKQSRINGHIHVRLDKEKLRILLIFAFVLEIEKKLEKVTGSHANQVFKSIVKLDLKIPFTPDEGKFRLWKSFIYVCDLFLLLLFF